MKPPPAADLPPLYAALLDYHRHPAQYSLARKEPPLLFASIRAILQLAAGKSGDERGAALQPAACFFVRSALICPAADHYALLGLARTSDAATVKEHYRLMMRLVHPDFSAGPGAAWPADAATRLNLAYEVLVSPEKRTRYDEDLTAMRPSPRASLPARNIVVTQPKSFTTDPRLLVKRLAGGFGVAGALGVAALLVTGGGDRESLVQAEAPFRTAVLPLLLEPPAMKPFPTRVAVQQAAPARIDTVQPEPAAQPASARSARIVTAAPEPIRVTEAPAPSPTVAPYTVPAVDAPAVTPPLAPVAPAPPNAGVTLAQVQPLLTTLLQQIESGRGDQLLNLLDRDARKAPAARALSRRFELLVDGARPIKLSHVEFRAEPAAEGRLFVIGHIGLNTGDANAAAAAKELSLRVEFMSRDGAVVMTGLADN